MILATKLYPPSLKPNLLRRERLFKLLRNHLERKLILICGDAGYGKTTLLVQIKEEARLPCVFYTLDRGDSDFVVFFSHLVYGLERVQSRLVPRSKGLLEHGADLRKNVPLAMGTLANELAEKRKQELFIILDDYHALTGKSPVHAGLDYFIERLPDRVRVIIASRTVPPLPALAKWRAKRDLFELTREDLRFTPAEVKAFFSEAYRRVLSEGELRWVSEQTEGWITGIQLIVGALGREGKTVREILKGYLEANQPLFDYFASEVLAREPSEVQDFLRKGSLLDTLAPEECDEIFGIRNSEVLLRDLEKRNVFLSPLGRGQYKYHRLFREFLQGQNRDTKARQALHLRAAGHYARKGRPDQAIEHYLEAGSHEEAGRAIAQAAYSLIEQARLDTLKSWLQRLPARVLERQAQLLAIQGRLGIEEGRLEEAEALCIRAETALRKGRMKRSGDAYALTDAFYVHGGLLWQKGVYTEALKVLRKALASCPPFEEKKRGDILNLIGVSWVELGEPGKAKAYLLRARSAVEQFQGYSWRFVIEHNLATLLREQGELRQVFGLHKSLIEQIRGIYFLEVGIIYACAAINALETGQTAWAEECLAQGRALCEPYQDSFSQAALDRGFGCLCLERSQWGPARDYLMQAREEFERSQCAIPTFYVLLDLIRLFRYQGDGAGAEKLVTLAREKVGTGENALEAQLLAECALLEAVGGNFEEAEQSIKKGLGLARRLDRKREEFLVLLACAWVYGVREKEDEARRWLGRALHWAKLKGYEGLLVRELSHSPYLLGLAQTLASSSTGRSGIAEFLKGVLKRCEAPVAKDRGVVLKAKLFGSLQVVLASGKLVPLVWRSRKVASLFAYLLLNRHRVCDREELMAALWPRAGLKQAGQNLYNAIFQLKKALSSGLRLAGLPALSQSLLIVHRERGYRLVPAESFGVDVEEFQRAWRSAGKETRPGKVEEALSRCLDLYQGGFLVNLGERWCEEHREEYGKTYLVCLRKLASLRAGKKEYEEASLLYRRYLELEPFSEEVHVELWRAWKALGMIADIKRDYKDLQLLLKRELKVSPHTDTTEAYRGLIAL